VAAFLIIQKRLVEICKVIGALFQSLTISVFTPSFYDEGMDYSRQRSRAAVSHYGLYKTIESVFV
ncbi:MAG: hypothetical protein KGJ14_05510, partial [Nitrospirota bacterium]|nr:hypothetical protein [Nitrospirota bacterium]